MKDYIQHIDLLRNLQDTVCSKFSEEKRSHLVREKYGSELAEILFTKGETVDASKLKKMIQDLDNYKKQLDLQNYKGLLGIKPYQQMPRVVGKYSQLQPTTVPEVYFPTDVFENK